MPIKINVGGRSAAKPAAKRATAKTTPKPTAKKATAAKATTAKSNDNGALGFADDRTVAAFRKRLAAAGKKRDSTEQAHADAVDEMFALAKEALEEGVRLSVVSEETGVSRQWLYKGLEAREAGPKKKPGRPPTKKPATATSAKPKAKAATTTRRGAKPAAKKTTGSSKRPRIAIKR